MTWTRSGQKQDELAEKIATRNRPDLDNLLRKLACWCQNERLAIFNFYIETLKDTDSESSSLARS
jgi:hypothetical protein